MPSSPVTQRLPAHAWFDKLASRRWLPAIAGVLAFALLLSGATQWTRRLTHSPAPAATPATAAAAQAPLDIQPLLSAQLFGEVQTSGSALPLSALNLVLTGVMAGGPSSFAFLSVDGAAQVFLGIGQEVVPGTVLEAVYPDSVVLRRGGMRETVLFKDRDETLAPGSIAVAAAEPLHPVHVSAINATSATNAQVTSQQTLAERQRAVNELAARPRRTAAGPVLQNVSPGSPLERMGLRDGDVVRSVNGQPVKNLAQAMRIYNSATRGPNAKGVYVEISRAGKTEVLTQN